MYIQDSFYRGLTEEELKHVHEYNFDHPGNKNCLSSECIVDDMQSCRHFMISKYLQSYDSFIADAFDTDQLVECIEKLKSGHPVQVPIYDFKTHQRSLDTFRQVLIFLIRWEITHSDGVFLCNTYICFLLYLLELEISFPICILKCRIRGCDGIQTSTHGSLRRKFISFSWRRKRRFQENKYIYKLGKLDCILLTF